MSLSASALRPVAGKAGEIAGSILCAAGVAPEQHGDRSGRDWVLDASTVEPVRAVLAPRLAAMVEVVLLDWSEMRFVGVAGLELLAEARRHGAARRVTVAVVEGPVCVDQALRAADWHEMIPTDASVPAAVAELSAHEPSTVEHA